MLLCHDSVGAFSTPSFTSECIQAGVMQALVTHTMHPPKSPGSGVDDFGSSLSIPGLLFYVLDILIPL